ncbi:hypothetical protein SD10_11730 [Spirosoma radiotolerans]|uniref:Lipocalin-like domain-containing protein n=1 Tax=Spirosoma radiotolerans TaxID=1379870 RepID=A0A0E3ZW29_9BACT|nr:hypothetical protein SD10_11730 [Spirosoma radiotolerans]
MDLVGTWELVTFTVDPTPINGTSDYLAYLRQIFGYNCSQIEFYYNFKSDNTFTETATSTCQSSGTTTDTVLEGTWAVTQTTLSLTVDDGTGTNQTNTYKLDAHPATAGKYAYINLTFTNSGTTYFISLNKQ